MTESKTLQILKQAILLEKRGQSFYQNVAEQAKNEAVQFFFKFMSEEEAIHIDILAGQFRAYMKTGQFEPDSFDENETSDIESYVINDEIKEKISVCLSVLTPKEKAIFLLRDNEGFSIKETAEILKSSSVSVRTHLSRARQKIRREFEKIYSAGQKEIQS